MKNGCNCGLRLSVVACERVGADVCIVPIKVMIVKWVCFPSKTFHMVFKDRFVVIFM